MGKSTEAIEGALERAENRPDLDFSNQECQGWDDQWNNWDDLGDGDPGWGDISD